jgi:hypothetical protein
MAELSNGVLERALTGLPIDWPETPDLAARLSLPAWGLPERGRARPPRWALAVALAVVAILGAILAVPQSRSAFLRIIHLGGEEIHIVEKLPPVPSHVDLEVALGRRTTLADAQRQVGFRIRVPDTAPDRVYLGEQQSVTLLYGTPTRVQALITESRGAVSQKFFAKSAQPGTHIEYLKVNGADGGFISGGPHTVIMIGPDGYPRDYTLRLARNVLLWSEGAVSYRIEGGFTRQQALDLAAQLVRDA